MQEIYKIELKSFINNNKFLIDVLILMIIYEQFDLTYVYSWKDRYKRITRVSNGPSSVTGNIIVYSFTINNIFSVFIIIQIFGIC